MLDDSRSWAFPPSSWEASVVEELLDLPCFQASRFSSDELKWMGMPQQHCHANARWYVEHDPTKSTAVATGWWMQWPDFLLHSVLERDGEYRCVTPTPFDEGHFPFIPDRKIEWRQTGDVYSPFREGHPIGIGVRRFPDFTIARAQLVTAKLLTCANPYDAMVFDEKEFEELKRKYIKE